MSNVIVRSKCSTNFAENYIHLTASDQIRPSGTFIIILFGFFCSVVDLMSHMVANKMRQKFIFVLARV